MKILPMIDSFTTDLARQLIPNFKYQRELNIMLGNILYDDIYLNIKLTLSTRLRWDL